jgi:hypothetical protein
MTVSWKSDREAQYVEQSFQVDKKGDPSNLVYGTIHRYSIPAYQRWGAGTIVGIPRWFKIERDASREGTIVIGDPASKLKRRERYIFARNEGKRQRKLRLRREREWSPIGLASDFIPLDVAAAKRNIEPNSDDEGGADYRSIEGKARHQGTKGADWQYASDSSISDEEAVSLDALNAEARSLREQLSRKVEEDPRNVQAWQELIDQQDTLLSVDGSAEKRHTTDAERRSIADVKLSMYEKALSRISKNQEGYEQLLCNMLETGSNIWEYDCSSSVTRCPSLTSISASKRRWKGGKQSSKTMLAVSDCGRNTLTSNKPLLPRLHLMEYEKSMSNALICSNRPSEN